MEEIEDWVLSLSGRYAHKTVLDIYGIFRRTMEYAWERRYVPHSPCPRKINMPKNLP